MKMCRARNLWKRFFFSALPAVLGTLFMTAAAFCAAAEGEVDHKAQLWDFMWRLLNLAVLVFILYKLAWKRLVNFFRNRREDIRTSLAETEERKVEAEEKFKEYEAKLTKATDDIQNISEMIKAQGHAEKQKLIADAEKTAEKMKEDARARMDQELKKAFPAPGGSGGTLRQGGRGHPQAECQQGRPRENGEGIHGQDGEGELIGSDIAKRYAKAFFDIAAEEQNYEGYYGSFWPTRFSISRKRNPSSRRF